MLIYKYTVDTNWFLHKRYKELKVAFELFLFYFINSDVDLKKFIY